MTVPDEEVFAFVDGELPPEAMARIEAAMSTDPQLALRIETQRALRRLLAGPHAGLSEPPPAADEMSNPDPKPASRLPPKAAEVIAFPGAKAKEKAGPKSKPPREPKAPKAAGAVHGRRPPSWVVMIAVLVVGMAIGRFAPPPPVIGGADDATRIAVGPLAHALNTADAGQVAGPVSLGESFRDGAGLYCRTFLAGGLDTVSGVACHEGAVWRVRAIIPAAPQNPAAVQAVVAAMRVGSSLSATDETQAKAAGWKASKGAAPRKD